MVDMHSKTEILARRNKLLAQMEPNSIALFFASPEVTFLLSQKHYWW